MSLLAEMLKVGPPVLTEIITCLEQVDTLKEFVALVRMLLPEHEAEIMSAPRNRRVYKFCFYFGKKYYPLPANTDCPPAEWVNGMPVELLAMSYSAYHALEMRPGYLLLLSLVIYPYEGDERDMEDDDVPYDPFDPMARFNMEAKFTEIAKGPGKKSEWRPKSSDIAWVKNLISTLQDGGKWIAPMGFTIIKIDDRNIELRQADNTPEVRETVHRTALIAEKAGIKVKVKVGRTAEEKQGKTLMEVFNGARVPLLDLVQRMVGEEIVRKIPGDGWTPGDLHRMTDGTHYDGVGAFADWVCSDTGCVVLDSSYENCDYAEGYGEPIFRWSKRNIDILTEQWPKVQEIRGKMDHIVEWLEVDQINHFTELVNYLLGFKLLTTKRSKERWYDPMQHVCELEQDTGEEKDDDESRE